MWSGLGPGLANYVTRHPPETFASAAKKATQNKLPHATNLEIAAFLTPTSLLGNKVQPKTRSPWQLHDGAPPQTPLMIWMTSSSARTWSLPTFWGWCRTEEPQTQAYLKRGMMPLWMRLQNSSTEGRFAWRTTGAS